MFVEKHPPGSTVEGEVKNKTEFGLFLGLDGDVDGMVHLSDLDWKRPGEQVIEEYKKGDMVKAQVLDVDVEKERISLGVKQLAGDPMESAGDLKKGSVVTCEVTEVKEAGIDVKIVGTELVAFIKRADLARERGEQRPERFSVGQKVDARVTQFDRKTHKVSVSIWRWKSPRKKRRLPNMVLLIQALPSETSWARRSSNGRVTSPKPKQKRPRSKRLAPYGRISLPSGFAPGVSFLTSPCQKRLT